MPRHSTMDQMQKLLPRDEDEVIIIIINHVQGPQLSTFSVAISNKYKIQKVKKSYLTVNKFTIT